MYQDEWPLEVGLKLIIFAFFPDFQVCAMRKYGNMAKFAPREHPVDFANFREIMGFKPQNV